MSKFFNIIEKLDANIEELKKIHNEELAADEEALLQAQSELDALKYLAFEQQVAIKSKVRMNKITELEDYRDQIEQNMSKVVEGLKQKTHWAHQKRIKYLKKAWFYSSKDSHIRKQEGHPFIDSDWTFAEVKGGYNFYSIDKGKYFNKYVLTGREHLDEKEKYGRDFLRVVYKRDGNRKHLVPGKFKSASGLQKLFNPQYPQASALSVIFKECFPSVNEYLGNEEAYPNFIDFMENQPVPDGDTLDMAIKRWVGIGTQEYAENNIEILKDYADYNVYPQARVDYSLVLPDSSSLTSASHYQRSAQRLPEAHYGVPKPSKFFDPLKFIEMMYFQRGSNVNAGSVTRAEISKLWENFKVKYNSENNVQYTDEEFNQMLGLMKFNLTNEASFKALREERNLMVAKLASNFLYQGTQYGTDTKGTRQMNTWPQTALPHEANDTATSWYWPRPKEGYVLIPGFDYIAPSMWTGAHTSVSQTAYWTNKRLREKLERQKKWIKVFSDVQAVLAEVMKFAQLTISIGISITVGWFDPTAGYVGIGNAIVNQTGVGNSDIGRILVKFGEVIAIANITDAAIQEVMVDLLEKEVQALATRELAEATGLDETAIGRMTASLAVGTAYNVYKDQAFLEALKTAGDKSWKLEAARQNPYAALVIAGATEIQKSGGPGIDSMNPMDWFENFSWESVGEGAVDVAKSIEGKDIAKLVGVALMVNAGYISGEDAALMIGQSMAIKSIESFNEDKPIQAPISPEMKNYHEQMARREKWHRGINGFRRVQAGGKITKSDIMFITDEVAKPIVERIDSVFPEGTQQTAYNVSLKIGLPGAIGWLPDVSVEPPEWAKKATKEAKTIYPPLSKEAVKKDIDEAIKKSTSKEHLEDQIASILIKWIYPRNEPLVQFTNSGVPQFNYIDELGNIKIRPPLRFPYIHPMLSYEMVKRKYSKEQQQYIDERNKEMKVAQTKIAEIKKKIAELQAIQEGTV